MHKYEITNHTKVVDGHVLHRIRALKNFSIIKAGDFGGFVETENNLSQHGNCWAFHNSLIYGNARVIENAFIFGNANIFDNALICGKAQIECNAKVFGNAIVLDKSWVLENAQVYGNAKLCGDCFVSGNAKVYEDAMLAGLAKVQERAAIHGEAFISGDVDIKYTSNIFDKAFIQGYSDYFVVPSVYKGCRKIVFFRCRNGLFKTKQNISIKDKYALKNKISIIYKDSDFINDYINAVESIL